MLRPYSIVLFVSSFEISVGDDGGKQERNGLSPRSTRRTRRIRRKEFEILRATSARKPKLP